MAGCKSLATHQLSLLETIEVENYHYNSNPWGLQSLLDEAAADID